MHVYKLEMPTQGALSQLLSPQPLLLLLCVQDKVKEARAAREAEEEAREQRLARLRALVAPEVEADPMRVLLPTGACLRRYSVTRPRGWPPSTSSGCALS